MSYNFDCEFQSDEAAALRKQIVNDVLFNDEPPDYDEIKKEITIVIDNIRNKSYNGKSHEERNKLLLYQEWNDWYTKILTPLYTTRADMDWSEYGMTHNDNSLNHPITTGRACGYVAPKVIEQPPPTQRPRFIDAAFGSNITAELYKMIMLQKKQIESQQKQMDELREMIEILPYEEVPTADLLGIAEQPNKPLGVSTDDWD